ncbi:hypothetical protein P9112_011503 [Eukaryota sp. TZLM1-RC]
MVGVQSISVGNHHNLLLSYSGEVYGWGYSADWQVLGCQVWINKSPVRLPLTNIVLSAGHLHSFALYSDGKLYGEVVIVLV